MAFPYLEMTDGTDTVTFANGLGATTNWPLIRGQWGPSISGIRTSPLAGRGPYADVVEDLSCNIRNTTAELVYGNLDTLTRLLDKAERWWLRNELINPVILKYVPQGSTIHSLATPLQAIVLGRAGSDELNGVGLPTSLNDAGMIFEIRGVKVLCLRRGAWTGATDTPAASAAAANCTVQFCTFATSHPINSPVDVVIGGFTPATTPTITPGFLMVGSSFNDISVLEAESLAGGAYTSVADAANLARGGSVLRYTPAVTTPVTTGPTAGLVATLNGPLAIYAAVRNNSGATSFLVSAVISGFSNSVTTPPVLVDTSSLLPRIIPLGTVVTTNATALQLQVQASAAAGTLDIDYLIVVNLRDESVAVIAHDAMPTTGFPAAAVTIQALFNPITDQNPSFKLVSAGGPVFSADYRGPLPLLTAHTAFDSVFALWVATNSNFWRFTNVANAIVNVTYTVTRRRSYLSPQ